MYHQCRTPSRGTRTIYLKPCHFLMEEGLTLGRDRDSTQVDSNITGKAFHQHEGRSDLVLSARIVTENCWDRYTSSLSHQLDTVDFSLEQVTPFVLVQGRSNADPCDPFGATFEANPADHVASPHRVLRG